MKFNGHIYWLRNILFRFIIQVFFLLKKVLFSRSIFQALTKQATNGICTGFLVKEGSEEKG